MKMLQSIGRETNQEHRAAAGIDAGRRVMQASPQRFTWLTFASRPWRQLFRIVKLLHD